MAGIFITKGKREPPQPGVPFLEMREGLCKRPLRILEQPATRFCGKPTSPGSPYCPECRKISYRADRRLGAER